MQYSSMELLAHTGLGCREREAFGAYLDEADVLGVAAEALPAAHEAVLPDQAVGVGAHTAAITQTNNAISISN